jgi:CRISPR-associated protein Cmr3
MPEFHAQTLQYSKGIAITLATPALFSGGWKPGWLDENLLGEVPGIPGLHLRLRAAAIERWHGLSGWDLKQKTPKLARKAVAAGATYWFEIIGTPPAGWEQALWLATLSDQPQDRRDGFGLTIPGPWDTQIIAQ